jgi:hypothetical protein
VAAETSVFSLDLSSSEDFVLARPSESRVNGHSEAWFSVAKLGLIEATSKVSANRVFIKFSLLNLLKDIFAGTMPK